MNLIEKVKRYFYPRKRLKLEEVEENLKLPKHMFHLYGNTRNFKREKRQQVRAVLQGLDDLQLGCTYLPSGNIEVREAKKVMENLKEKLSIKKWGR